MERPRITVAMPGDAAGDSLAGQSGQGIAFDGGWAGVVRLDPGSSTTWHHHGNSQAIGFVLSGAIRIESGPGGIDTLEATAGQLVHIPRFIVHRESAVGSHEATLVVVRMGTEKTTDVGGPS